LQDTQRNRTMEMLMQAMGGDVSADLAERKFGVEQDQFGVTSGQAGRRLDLTKRGQDIQAILGGQELDLRKYGIDTRAGTTAAGQEVTKRGQTISAETIRRGQTLRNSMAQKQLDLNTRLAGLKERLADNTISSSEHAQGLAESKLELNQLEAYNLDEYRMGMLSVADFKAKAGKLRDAALITKDEALARRYQDQIDHPEKYKTPKATTESQMQAPIKIDSAIDNLTHSIHPTSKKVIINDVFDHERFKQVQAYATAHGRTAGFKELPAWDPGAMSFEKKALVVPYQHIAGGSIDRASFEQILVDKFEHTPEQAEARVDAYLAGGGK